MEHMQKNKEYLQHLDTALAQLIVPDNAVIEEVSWYFKILACLQLLTFTASSTLILLPVQMLTQFHRSKPW